MGEKRRNWTWKHRVALGALVVLAVPIVVVLGLRKPWIRPLPGVRMGMARPPVYENELGPDSAYRLLLRATEMAYIPVEDRPVLGFSLGMGEAAGPAMGAVKLKYRPRPSTEPPSLAERVAALKKRMQKGPKGATEDEATLRYRAASLDEPWTRELFRAMQPMADLPAECLSLIDAAMVAPVSRMPIERAGDDSYAFLTKVGELLWRLEMHAAQASAKGDYETAFADVSRTLAISHFVCRGGGVGGIESLRWWDDTSTIVPWIIATAGAPPPALLKAAARDILERIASMEPYVEIVRADALVNQNLLPDAYADTKGEILELADDHGLPTWQRRSIPLLLGFAPLAGSNIEAASAHLDCFSQHVVALAERTYSPEVCDAYDEFIGRIKAPRSWPELVFRTQDPVGLLVLDQFCTRFRQYHEDVVSHKARWLGVGLFLAARAYELEHGAPPASLGRLVPDYLTEIPLDPFDGQPMRYKTEGIPNQPAGIWAVYSIGPNFVDDGGLDHEKAGAVKNTPGGDFAWTSSSPYPPE